MTVLLKQCTQAARCACLDVLSRQNQYADKNCMDKHCRSLCKSLERENLHDIDGTVSMSNNKCTSAHISSKNIKKPM